MLESMNILNSKLIFLFEIYKTVVLRDEPRVFAHSHCTMDAFGLFRSPYSTADFKARYLVIASLTPEKSGEVIDYEK